MHVDYTRHNNVIAYCDGIIISTIAIHFVASSAPVRSEQVCRGASTATAAEERGDETPRPKSGASACGVGLKTSAPCTGWVLTPQLASHNLCGVKSHWQLVEFAQSVPRYLSEVDLI